MAGVPLGVGLLQGAQGLHLLVRGCSTGVASLGLTPEVVPGRDEVLAGGCELQLLCHALASHLGPSVFVLFPLDVALTQVVQDRAERPKHRREPGQVLAWRRQVRWRKELDGTPKGWGPYLLERGHRGRLWPQGRFVDGRLGDGP